MSKIRLLYSKTGKAKYISHLDLMATMRRALLRAGIELKYSEGFNPHPYMSVALPLPVGCSSICELIDIGITLGAPILGWVADLAGFTWVFWLSALSVAAALLLYVRNVSEKSYKSGG